MDAKKQTEEKDNKARVVVNIYGEEYVVKGAAKPGHIEMLASYVDRKMVQIGQKNPQLSIAKVAVLAALNIADELTKLQEDYETLVKILEDKKENKT